jgi:hypothetical protein
MLLVQGEVPPRRFFGRWKDFGPCYTRGIVEGNGNPPGDDMWITYSMNKEDMWVSRIPLPIHSIIDNAIDDNFNRYKTDGNIFNWNIYSPLWAPISVKDFPNKSNKSLELRDKDPYDYARAIRIFKEGNQTEIDVKVLTKQTKAGMLEIDVVDRFGNRPVRIRFDQDGKIKAQNGEKEIILQNYVSEKWYDLKLIVKAQPYGHYHLYIGGKSVLSDANLAEAVLSVERLSFRTGPYRNIPNRKTPNEEPGPPLPGADDPVFEAVFYIDDVSIISN